jgi:hypothetical protein
VDLFRSFCKSRYQSLILQRVTAVFISLRGQLSDQMREVGFCRDRLKELCRLLEGPGLEGGAADGAEKGPELARCLFPVGCKNLGEATADLLARVTPADREGLDQRVQALIRKQFTALVHVCLASANMLRGLEAAMRQEAEDALGEKLCGAHVIEMFLTQPVAAGAAPADPAEQIRRAFAEAAPDLAGLLGAQPFRTGEVCILAAPPEPEDKPEIPRLRGLARQQVGDNRLLIANAQEGLAAHEILFYREEACLSLADLQLLGPLGRGAYAQMNRVEHFTPHTRIDIPEWHGAPSR